MSLSNQGSDQRQDDSGSCHGCDALLVVTHLSPGGTREVLTLIAQELRARGLKVAIVALYRGHEADIHDFPCDIIVDRERLNARGYAKAFIQLTSRIKAMQPAALLSFMPAANIMGALSGVAVGVRRRIATHHQPGWTQHPVLRTIDRVLGSLGVYSHVIAVSESIRTSFAAYPRGYRDRICVIPNAIRPIAPRNDRLAVRRHFGLRGDAVLVAAIGRLSPEKNLFNTLAGAARVAGIQLALVGDGPLRDDIERYIAAAHLDGKVFLLGQVDHQVATDILFAADVFIQLSTFEGRSLSLLEALYAETTIVASDIPSQREVLTMSDGSLAGLVCDPDDVNAITAAISGVTTNDRLRRKLAAKASILKRGLDSMQMGREYANLVTGARIAPNVVLSRGVV